MKNAQGEKETDFINCQVPPYKKQLAELAANYLAKGKLAAIDGRIQVRTYNDNNGQKHWVTEVIAEDVRFLSPKDDNTGAPAQYQQQQQTQYAPPPYQPPQQQPQYGQQPPGQYAPPGYQQQQPPQGQGQWQAPPPGYQAPPNPNMPNPNFPPPPSQQQHPQWLGQTPQNPPSGQIDLNQIGRQVNLGDDIPF